MLNFAAESTLPYTGKHTIKMLVRIAGTASEQE